MMLRSSVGRVGGTFYRSAWSRWSQHMHMIVVDRERPSLRKEVDVHLRIAVESVMGSSIFVQLGVAEEILENRKWKIVDDSKSTRAALENAQDSQARKMILEEKRHLRDCYTFWIPLILHLQRGKHHAISLEVFDWIREQATFLRSLSKLDLSYLYTLGIWYVGLVTCNTKRASSLFEDMLKRDVPKSTFSCNALLMGYGNNFQVDKDRAIAIFNNMQSSFERCPPNYLSYQILIAMYARWNELEKMEEIHKASEAAGIASDVFCFNILMAAYAIAKRSKKLEDTYRTMRVRDVERNAVSFQILICGFGRMNMMKMMEEAIDDMNSYNKKKKKKKKISLTSAMAEEILNAYARLGRSDKVEETMKNLRINNLCTGRHSQIFDSLVNVNPAMV